MRFKIFLVEIDNVVWHSLQMVNILIIKYTICMIKYTICISKYTIVNDIFLIKGCFSVYLAIPAKNNHKILSYKLKPIFKS